MILRTWRGWTRREDADGYFEYLAKTGVKDIEATPGNHGVLLTRREEDGRTEFLFMSLWDSLEAVKGFAGPDPERAVFYPEDDGYLVEKDEHIDHWDVLRAPPGLE
ncbi:MAG: antibiotic biosynthesis monooxygenase [Candidatus Palauibacterales bacterium]|nr:antibiotic biosynthesis monooxygenase [Candidatus Palauibacterales bacterium]MDP2529999.1 antibiotic biosynthesis monooxygenase [Candidatus Palauibacterales bacterium]MDP2585034.1 antibiotic biosynthesis monooxygenase [Candidatus Palauibacterales bacterium]